MKRTRIGELGGLRVSEKLGYFHERLLLVGLMPLYTGDEGVVSAA
jgi:hypothetical protein